MAAASRPQGLRVNPKKRCDLRRSALARLARQQGRGKLPARKALKPAGTAAEENAGKRESPGEGTEGANEAAHKAAEKAKPRQHTRRRPLPCPQWAQESRGAGGGESG